MPTFDTLRQDFDERALIRKIQKALAVIAPPTVDLPDTLFTGAGTLLDLKTLGWKPVGIVTPDGYDFGREISKEDVSAFGYAGPARSDTTGVARSVTFTPLEHGRRHMLELTDGLDLSAITQDQTTGEIVYDELDLPIGKEYRLLIIGSDGPADNNWILGKGYPLVKLASTDNEKWGSSDPVTKPITLDIFNDDELGTPARKYIGGTGALKHKEALGFTAATP